MLCGCQSGRACIQSLTVHEIFDHDYLGSSLGDWSLWFHNADGYAPKEMIFPEFEVWTYNFTWAGIKLTFSLRIAVAQISSNIRKKDSEREESSAQQNWKHLKEMVTELPCRPS